MGCLADLAPAQMILSLAFPLGCIVQTPLNRRAEVKGYTDEGRLELRYADETVNQRHATVDLWPALCKRLTQ